jgi:hypothetical protein
MEASWLAQLRAAGPLEVSDPLCGVEPAAEFKGRPISRHHRWIWPVAPGQTHVMEAMRIASGNPDEILMQHVSLLTPS